MKFSKRKFACLTIAAILLPILIFGFIGCMKKPDHTPNFGPEVTFEEIEKAAVNDMPPEPLEMKKGQYTSIDVTQVIDTNVPTTISQKLETISDRTDSPTEALLKFEITLNELDSTGIWKQSKEFPTLLLVKEATNEEASLKRAFPTQMKAEKFSSMNLEALQTQEEPSPVKVTFHNLKREDGFMAVPLLVKNQPDCGGLKDCNKGLRFMRLSFDRVLWENDGKGTKTSYRITYSPDVPTYVVDWSDPRGLTLTNQIQFCAQTWLEVANGAQTQVVPVQQCSDMRDFQHGS